MAFQGFLPPNQRLEPTPPSAARLSSVPLAGHIRG